MKPAEMLPLYRGALALRFLVEIKTRRMPGLDPCDVAVVTGVQCVEVLAVVGDVVTWTNHTTNRAGRPGLAYVGASTRRELIALDAIEFLPALAEGIPADVSPLAQGGAAQKTA